jgi:uncharacterized protein YjbI with pentapeptide repeats
MVDTTQTESRTGAKMQSFEEAIANCSSVEISASFALQTGEVESYRITAVPKSQFVRAQWVEKRKQITQRSIANAMIALTKDVSLDRITAIKVKAAGGAIENKELKILALEAWCEAVQIAAPNAKVLAQEAKLGKTAKLERQATLRTEFLADLCGGASGLSRWHSKGKEQRELGTLEKADLQGCNLQGVNMTEMKILGEANFADCHLEKADFSSCALNDCRFQNAIMDSASLTAVDASGADFSGASLVEANMRYGVFRRAKFVNADLKGVDLYYADLCGADLSSSELSNANLEKTKYDENTLWPAGFLPPDGLLFVGKGKDPFLIERVKALAGGNVDFNAFVARLESGFDQERLKKALKMLKAESFQLFAEVKPDSMVGVVKSQTDADLVYSCRLQDSGTFACCTQSLHPCGGLRGSLCKHLLVLLIGLTKAGELDATDACAWVLASGGKKPFIDKDIMTSTLLRYKGAEAGEIDWRPTETMPEDYYAF